MIIDGGPANVSTNFGASIICINEGLQALAEKAQQPIEHLTQLPSFVGLAGVKSQKHIDNLRIALPMSNALYAEDRAAALRGALGKTDGYLVHCGTGSFFALQLGLNVRYAGGWGTVLGDEASAAWVGRRALSLTLQCEDGFYSHSLLTQKLLDMHNGAEGIVDFANQALPHDFGELAPLVTNYALENDSIAKIILQNAASCINDALNHLGWVPNTPLCLSGAIASCYLPYLSEVQRSAVVPPKTTPLEGAISLAIDFANHHNENA